MSLVKLIENLFCVGYDHAEVGKDKDNLYLYFRSVGGAASLVEFLQQNDVVPADEIIYESPALMEAGAKPQLKKGVLVEVAIIPDSINQQRLARAIEPLNKNYECLKHLDFHLERTIDMDSALIRDGSFAQLSLKAKHFDRLHEIANAVSGNTARVVKTTQDSVALIPLETLIPDQVRTIISRGRPFSAPLSPSIRTLQIM